MNTPQKTIADQVRLSGKGMFGGKDAKVLIRPAQVNTGIVFVRADLDVAVKIPAVIDNVAHRQRRTALEKGKLSIETIEHCMAAVSGLELDNLIIEVSGPEMPALDGGSGEYYKVLKKAGTQTQSAPRSEFSISEEISISEDGSYIYALPCEDPGLNISYEMDYTKHTGIGKQLFSCQLSPEYFGTNLAPARTFLLEAEAKQFQASGIGTHLSPKDILVIGSDGPIKNSFRFPDECVRHKVVDLIGDLALAGTKINGRIVAYKSGHRLNQKLAAKIDAQKKNSERLQKVGTDALLDIRRIQKILPHRYPFLLVDKVIEINGDKSIRAVKNITYNELFFQGHFPGTPIMPGVLILEAMAQASGLLFAQKLENTGRLAVLLGMDSVKLRKAVVPGDQLILGAEVVRARNRTAVCRCYAMVGSNKAAEADIKFMLVDDDIV